MFEKAEFIIFIILLSLGIFYSLFFYYFGWLEVLIHHNTQFYTTIISVSFSLGGFSMAVAGFLSQTKNKKVKHYSRVFLFHSSLFILSGVFLFAGILIAEITRYFPIETINKNIWISTIFNFFLIIGSIGVVLFFLDLPFLVYSFIYLLKSKSQINKKLLKKKNQERL